jgi:hypothetical protein
MNYNYCITLAALLLAANEPLVPDKPAPISAPAATAAAIQEAYSSMIIDPKARAQDYREAFELLRREKPSLKINIQTSSGPLTNVSELSSAGNGTLMLVKIPFSQGTKYLIVPIEEIKEIAYSP